MGGFHLTKPWNGEPVSAPDDSGFGVDPKLIADAMASILDRDGIDIRNTWACTERLREVGFSRSSINRHLPQAIRICRRTAI